ncbi:hypothetical protein GGI00_001412 [Coemansia sp. RSA 2681]|nr:hypothetical protein GGI00_001412 [Coemansia sp. RSA 2681]
MAHIAKMQGYCQPMLENTGCIHIIHGRHPVHEYIATTTSFIPNDFHLAEHDCSHLDAPRGQLQRTAVLVGPNASGKSVLLKQIALIVYMAHIGCSVPAKSARVGLIDRVLAMGKSTESLSRKMSALSADLSAVAKIVELASSRSLVLLDEFGRGTAPVDGVSLLCGILASLSLRSQNRPSVLAATHFQGKQPRHKQIRASNPKLTKPSQGYAVPCLEIEVQHISCVRDIWTRAQVKSMGFKESANGLVYLYK